LDGQSCRFLMYFDTFLVMPCAVQATSFLLPATSDLFRVGRAIACPNAVLRSTLAESVHLLAPTASAVLHTLNYIQPLSLLRILKRVPSSQPRSGIEKYRDINEIHCVLYPTSHDLHTNAKGLIIVLIPEPYHCSGALKQHYVLL